MCGILGVVGRPETHQQRFRAALDSIAHRGPDGEGIYSTEQILFGHRRLAIIDLGPGGFQPMVDAATGTTVTFNGEIYNYVEVRAELEALGVTFRTRSDTEVLLRAFLQWREGMLPRLNGMWAFAIWEPAARLLTLSRDRFGVKPIYWHIDRGTLLFASEAKALVALLPKLAEPDFAAVRDMIVDSRSHAGDASYYRGIAALPPATVATFRVGDAAPAVKRFWDYPPAEGARGRRDDDEAFAELFEDAVRLRLRSDVPVGLTLSGGLDSSAVLAGAQKQLATPMRCYTSVYGATERGEERWATTAATAWGAALESVSADQTAWLPTLQKIVRCMDGPGFSPAVFPLWAIMARARADGVPVLLEGQGADELLAGYPQYGAAYLGEVAAGVAKASTSLAEARTVFRELARTFGTRQLLLWMLRQQAEPLFRHFGPRRDRERLFRDPAVRRAPSTDATKVTYGPLARALHRDHSDAVLPALLHYGDAISMAHGIETRLPFMDYRLVEWVFRARPALMAGGRSKAPVRRYLAANRLQAIANRVDKAGYPTMIARWLNTGDGAVLVDDLVASPNAAIWQVLDRRTVAALVSRARSGDYVPIFHLYKIVATHLWLTQQPEPTLPPAREPQPAMAMA